MKIVEMNINNIIPSRDPIRRELDSEKVDELAASIKAGGLISPIKVRPTEDPGEFEVVYGNRRLSAAKRAGLDTVNVIVEEIDDQQALIEAFTENEQREQMNPIDTATALQRIKDQTGWSMRQMEAHGLGSQTWISYMLSLLKEEESVQKMIKKGTGSLLPDGTISERHVRMARKGGLEDSADRAKILNKAAMETLTSEETKEVSEAYNSARDDAEREAIIDTPYHDPSWKQIVRAKSSMERGKAVGKRESLSPSVKAYLDALRAFRTAVMAVSKSVDMFSPEAKRYVSNWHDDVIEKIMELDELLEEKDA